MIWRVVHSNHGFQFRSTMDGPAWPEAIFTRTDDFGLPLIGPLAPRLSLQDGDEVAVDAAAGLPAAPPTWSALRDAA